MSDIALSCPLHDAYNSIPEYILRYFPLISDIYSNMYVVVTSATHEDVVSALEKVGAEVIPQKGGGVGKEFISDARRQAIRASFKHGHSHTHFVEVDRLLQWYHKYPQELRSIVEQIPSHDFLIIGRTKRAFDTHTKCQINTERLSNRVCSLLLGKEVDITCASRGISREAGEVILQNSKATYASTDSEWPMIIKCCTDFPIGYIEVEGLEFEALFRHPEKVMRAGGLKAFKQSRDQDPESWLWRIRIVEQICSTAISTYQSLV